MNRRRRPYAWLVAAAGGISALAVFTMARSAYNTQFGLVIALGSGAVTLAVALLYRNRGRRASPDRVIGAIGRAVEARLDPDWLYGKIADEIRSILPYDRFIIFSGRPDESDRILYAQNLYEEIPGLTPELRSGISAPLAPEGEPAGRLVLFSVEEDAYADEDLDVLQRIALEVGPAISDTCDGNRSRRSAADESLIADLKDEIEQFSQLNREVAEANRELEWRNSQVQDSRTRIMDAHESVKRLVAEELHGGVQTKLYANWIKLLAVRDSLQAREEPEAESLSAIADDLDQIREQDIRQLSHRLHPSVIRLGLGAGMRSLRDHVEDVIQIDLDISEEIAALEKGGESAIPENVRLALYRLAELAVGNVVKHARAEKCSISLALDEGNDLHLMIVDDGVGFPPDARIPAGFGIAMMNDYTDSLDGDLTVISLPGEGTRIDVRVPLDRWQNASDAGESAIGTLVNMHWASPDGPGKKPDETADESARAAE